MIGSFRFVLRGRRETELLEASPVSVSVTDAQMTSKTTIIIIFLFRRIMPYVYNFECG